jgi:CAAX prenyl protease-like protein
LSEQSQAVPHQAHWPSIPYVLPFVLFLALHGLQSVLPLDVSVEYPLRLALLTARLLLFSRRVIDLRCTAVIQTITVGIGVFVIWIAPDVLLPGYRQHWIFQNELAGWIGNNVPEPVLTSPVVLWSRILRASAVVPIIEELFWRAWLMRWLISPKFERVNLGAYRPAAFWFTAILFASEHGPYWDVGLAAGIIYNWWMVRTRNLTDCIIAHAVTNGLLSAYILATHQFQYWM